MAYTGKHSEKKQKEQKKREKKIDYSKMCTRDIRPLLWVVTVGGLVLAFFAIFRGYTGSLPWIGAMVGLPWTAYGTVCSFYLNMAKADHSAGGITFEAAKANGFSATDGAVQETAAPGPVYTGVQDEINWESPRI